MSKRKRARMTYDPNVGNTWGFPGKRELKENDYLTNMAAGRVRGNERYAWILTAASTHRGWRHRMQRRVSLTYDRSKKIPNLNMWLKPALRKAWKSLAEEARVQEEYWV